MDIPASLASALPLSPDMRLTLDALTEREKVDWATRQMLGRMRNLGLITASARGYHLTSLGHAVRRVGSEHRLETGRKQLGRGMLAGSGMRYGITARCSCREWTGSRNESGQKALRAIVKSHATHMLTYLAD